MSQHAMSMALSTGVAMGPGCSTAWRRNTSHQMRSRRIGSAPFRIDSKISCATCRADRRWVPCQVHSPVPSMPSSVTSLMNSQYLPPLPGGGTGTKYPSNRSIFMASDGNRDDPPPQFLVNRPGGSGAETTGTAPEPGVEQVAMTASPNMLRQ